MAQGTILGLPRGAIAILLLPLLPTAPALAQAATYRFGFCLGIAGTTPTNHITRAFVLGPTNGDLRAEFMRDLNAGYGGNVRRDATGCRMFATAAEAQQTRAQLLEQARSGPKPFVAIDWLPKGATAIPKRPSDRAPTTPAADTSPSPRHP